MNFNPHPYQQRGIQWIKDHDKCGLFLPMGAGKTATTLKALEELKMEQKFKRALIIGPKRVIESTWPDELEKWNCSLTYSVIAGTPQKRMDALSAEADVYLIGKENVQWLCSQKWKFDFLIIDELSTFKNPQAKRFKALKLKNFNRFVGLTGTPSPKGVPDLWAQIYLMDKGRRLGKTLTRFRNEYLIPGRRDGHVVYEWLPKPGAQERIQNRISDICMSIDQAEYASLPDVSFVDQAVHLGRDLNKYQKFKAEMVIENRVTASNAGVLCGKLSQFASGQIYDDEHEIVTIHKHKIEALQELMESANGQPVMIFYWYEHERERIVEALKGYNGADHADAETIRKWNAKELDYLLLQPASAGHGLNLQNGGHIAVWYSLPNWNLELYQQANARLYRQGQKEKVTIIHLLAQGTIDELMLAALKRKRVTQDDLLKALR